MVSHLQLYKASHITSAVLQKILTTASIVFGTAGCFNRCLRTEQNVAPILSFCSRLSYIKTILDSFAYSILTIILPGVQILLMANLSNQNSARKQLIWFWQICPTMLSKLGYFQSLLHFWQGYQSQFYNILLLTCFHRSLTLVVHQPDMVFWVCYCCELISSHIPYLSVFWVQI